jgi:hypothetical protein
MTKYILTKVHCDEMLIGKERVIAITESELKKRLAFICDMPIDPNGWIDILLHGEGKEQPQDAYLEGIMKKSDRPEPPTDEWEAWAERVANFIYADIGYRMRCKDVLITIPCNPRRKP